MEEMIDVINPNTGEKTGEIITKSEAHSKGMWHSSIHLLIVNKDRTKTILQKRCAEKKLYPNMWDIAVGGHISSGEDELTSVKREAEEELGLNPDKYEIKFLKRCKEELKNNGVNSKEFVSIFVIEDDIDIKDITLQEEEVSEAKWFDKNELNSLIKDGQMLPHSEDYKILNELLK